MQGLTWPLPLTGWVPPGWQPELPLWLAWPLASALLLLLAAGLTPRHWWRQLTLFAMLGIVGGGYVLARLLGPLVMLPEPALALAAPGGPGRHASHVPPAGRAGSVGQVVSVDSAGAVGSVGFRVREPLNLRRAAGTDAPWLVTLPGGALVRPTGQRRGDWWQVTSVGHTGWVNSLWLRQIGENPAPMR